MILGLTGNIASGKSTVAELLGKKGAVLLSADQLSREVVAPGTPLLRRLFEIFGRRIQADDGGLDRAALAQIVFADEAARKQLNALLHPAIGRLAERRLAALREAGAPLIVYEAPLLFEVAAEKRVDRVLMVTIAAEEQLRRLMVRDGLDADAARRRIATQMPQAEKAARADFVIDNSGNRLELEGQVERLWQELTSA